MTPRRCAQLPGVQYVAAGVNSRAQVIAGNQNWSTQIQGTDVDLPLIRNWPTKYGSFFTPQDVDQRAEGRGPRHRPSSDNLFGPDVDPTGQIIRIKNQPFKVHRRDGAARARADSARIRTTRSTRRTRRCRRSCRASSTSTTSPSRPRRRRRLRCRQPISRDPAHAPQADRATIRTTSWCARRKKWPASAPRPPRP